MKKLFYVFLSVFLISGATFAQETDEEKKPQKGHVDDNKFRQLKDVLATPNDQRTASGAPGHQYTQQKVDYVMNLRLDEANNKLYGDETITYHNNSKDNLEYLWLQLDQNMRAPDSQTPLAQSKGASGWQTPEQFVDDNMGKKKDFGFKIEAVKYEDGRDLSHTINRTMMRINLPKPLAPGNTFVFKIKWNYLINNSVTDGGRSGFEEFKDGNKAYTIAQFFPRLCVYNNVEGWQNMQFWGRSEFALEFGDYDVKITVPADHILDATGELQNEKDVLSKEQRSRMDQARKSYKDPVFIVTQKEAEENEKEGTTKTKTWHFKAKDVRDYAFASSRKYIWDAMAVNINGKTVMAVSLYPKEGNPLWEEHSTRVVANTLEEYSKLTFDYPYPKAISVHADRQGMEYPMICFNYGRPDPDGTYSERTKNGMIGVITHEVGHNFFPMIVNSDERQWTWMDEGLNSFLERETKRLRYPDLDLSWGSPQGITRYMKGDKNNIRPIMTNSEQVKQFGYNAYGKPAAALTLLRETVMDSALFDKAFKTYAERWAFKHPTPSDFFRSMEDASAVDLDWFWRGWFYSVDHVDVTVDEVKWFRLKQESQDPENKTKKAKKGDLGASKDEGQAATDFSDGPSEITVIDTDPRYYGEFQNRVDDNAIRAKLAGKNIYEVKFKNQGGLVTPLLVEFTYKDGTKEMQKIPAEIWRYNESEITKVFVLDKEVTNIVLDPTGATADTNLEDNVFPKAPSESKLDEFKEGK